MELKEFLKLRVKALQKIHEETDNLPTNIRISGKIHEIDIILDFLNNGSMDRIFDIR